MGSWVHGEKTTAIPHFWSAPSNLVQRLGEKQHPCMTSIIRILVLEDPCFFLGSRHFLSFPCHHVWIRLKKIPESNREILAPC